MFAPAPTEMDAIARYTAKLPSHSVMIALWGLAQIELRIQLHARIYISFLLYIYSVTLRYCNVTCNITCNVTFQKEKGEMSHDPHTTAGMGIALRIQ